MGGQNESLNAQEINKVISGTITSQLVQSWSGGAINNNNIQIILDSSNCSDVNVTENMVAINVDTSIFQDSDTYQSTVTDIVNNIKAAQEAKESGLDIFGSQDQNLSALIQSIVENSVTQSTMDINSSMESISNNNLQTCINSDNSMTVYASSNEAVGDFYYITYQQNYEIQKASTDISNSMDLSQSEKKTGFLHTLIVVIALVILLVIIFVIIAVFVYIMVSTM